jgi:hypothetical protein
MAIENAKEKQKITKEGWTNSKGLQGMLWEWQGPTGNNKEMVG